LSKWDKHVKRRYRQGPEQNMDELFTPEQRKQLESLGYL